MYQSPLTPADLLIALHNMDDKVDMKTTIKGNIGICYVISHHKYCFRKLSSDMLLVFANILLLHAVLCNLP